jgi:hypothetical protein
MHSLGFNQKPARKLAYLYGVNREFLALDFALCFPSILSIFKFSGKIGPTYHVANSRIKLFDRVKS